MSSKYSKSDLMKLAIEEHLKCVEYPRVGVVVAKSGEVVATGYRGETKGVHAERVALRKLTDEVIQGATVFTTLEPCVELHEGQEIKSCVQLLINSGVNAVIPHPYF
jgi:diaminohydroxyphosphoribosylaminopyrimidine deaminase/5-amino-6-(5-phosphoribosylamino)uracil reductase